MRLSHKPWLLVPILAAGIVCLPQSAEAKQKTLTLVHYWGGVEHTAFIKVAEAYEKKTGIKVKVVGSATNELMLAMLAGGNPPDILIIDEWVASWALRGILSPLDKFIKASNTSKDDFWSASWRECEWEGKVYAIPWFSDPNFAMWYNKNAFAEVGLPNHTPVTVSDFEVADAKLSIMDADTRAYKRVAWVPYGSLGSMANTVYQWGWIFGGDFYDAKAKKITADAPKIVKALEWLKAYVIKRGGTRAYSALGSGFAGGKICMEAEIGASPLKYKFEHGVGSMPVADGVSEPSEWVGGQKIAIPKGVKDPQASWDFLKYIAATKEGTEIYCNTAKARFISYKPSPAYDRFRRDPDLAYAVKILGTAVHQRPIIPVAEVLVKQLSTVISQVIDKNKEPRPILVSLSDLTQKELNQALQRFGKK